MHRMGCFSPDEERLAPDWWMSQLVILQAEKSIVTIGWGQFWLLFLWPNVVSMLMGWYRRLVHWSRQWWISQMSPERTLIFGCCFGIGLDFSKLILTATVLEQVAFSVKKRQLFGVEQPPSKPCVAMISPNQCFLLFWLWRRSRYRFLRLALVGLWSHFWCSTTRIGMVGIPACFWENGPPILENWPWRHRLTPTGSLKSSICRGISIHRWCWCNLQKFKKKTVIISFIL